MLLDVRHPSLLVAQPLRRVIPAEPAHQRDGALVDVAGEAQRVQSLQDDFVRLHGVERAERGAAEECTRKRS